MSVLSDWNAVKMYWTNCSETHVEVWIFTPINTVITGMHEAKVANIHFIEDVTLKTDILELSLLQLVLCQDITLVKTDS
jgi:hypothetical protein